MTDPGCHHVEVSPGQMCGCLDELMMLRFTVHLMARRIDQLETQAQRGEPRLVDVKEST